MRTFHKIPSISRLILLIGSIGLAVVGCNGEDHHRFVDFSKTIAVPSPDMVQQTSRHLHVAVAAMISPKETLIYYNELLAYLTGRLGYDVRLIQRRTYREVNELFLKGQLDLAFICTGPYVTGRRLYGFEGLATPVIRGQPYYQSYLIVSKHSTVERMEQLRGKSFAFTDPDSNTGSLVPRYWLAVMDESPATFFSNSIYTYSHDNSIMAVARSLVDAAAVDGHQWEYFNLRNPQYTRMTRVIKKSKLFGNPPLVASVNLEVNLKTSIRNVLFTMHKDPQGKRILDHLLIDRFEPPDDAWYQPVRDMVAKIRTDNDAPVKNLMAPHP